MNIDELIHSLEAIRSVEGQESLEVFVLDDDNTGFPLVGVEVKNEWPDDPGGLKFLETPNTKGVCLIWL